MTSPIPENPGSQKNSDTTPGSAAHETTTGHRVHVITGDHVTPQTMPDPLANELNLALLTMNSAAALAILDSASRRLGAIGATDLVLAPALEKIGDAWQAGNLSLAQVYMAGRIAEKIVAVITPGPGLAESPARGIGITVFEDFHTLGKTMVLSILRSSGFPVIDLGQGLTIDAITAAMTEKKLDALFVSVLMHRSALRIKHLVAAIRARGLETPVIVGGAPFLFDRQLWKAVGADGMGASASDAIGIAARFVDRSPVARQGGQIPQNREGA